MTEYHDQIVALEDDLATKGGEVLRLSYELNSKEREMKEKDEVLKKKDMEIMELKAKLYDQMMKGVA